MPYIPQANRQTLDPLIDKLASQIVHQAQSMDYDGAFAGLLNYACTRLALKMVRQQFGSMRYWIIADLPPVVVPSFKLGWGSSQAIDPGGV